VCHFSGILMHDSSNVEAINGRPQTASSSEDNTKGCSRLLLWAGAAVFLVGDAFLYEIKHVNFFVSAAIGILGGVLVMLLGAGIAVASKSPRSRQHFD
jgi:hypothetical protein